MTHRLKQRLGPAGRAATRGAESPSLLSFRNALPFWLKEFSCSLTRDHSGRFLGDVIAMSTETRV